MKQETLTAAEYRRRAGLAPAGADRPRRSPRRERHERMNKTEAAYAQRLDLQQRTGLIKRWRFEPLTLVLADDVRYRPDFLVEKWRGAPELHEVKGYWRDDARVKFRIAAEQYPMFQFVIVSRKSRSWEFEWVNLGWTNPLKDNKTDRQEGS